MASKAATRAAVDFAKVSSRVNEIDLNKLNRLKAQLDATGVKASSLPDSLPAVDWSYYKAHAVNPKLVEEIEKKYAAIKVERPKVPSKRLEDLQRAYQQDIERYNKFREFAQSYIEAAEVVKKKFENMIPVKEMNFEEWTLTFPHWSWTKENPSIFPHWGRTVGLTREEAAAFDQPDPLPYATPTAWKDWDTKYKKWYQ